MEARNEGLCERWLKIFEIDIERIRGILERLAGTREEQKGMQPELVYDCYIRHAEAARNTNALCLTCSRYDGCRAYLEAVKLKPPVKSR